MLAGERMSKPVITVAPDLPIPEAHKKMRDHQIRRLPVVNSKGKLVGIISNEDVINASPSPATSLSIWEINYLINKIKVQDVMTGDVLTVNVNDTIEHAARLMADNKIGGLPVMSGEEVAGIITETDLFKLFMELTGARDQGLRVTVVVPDKIGEIAALTKPISEAGGDIIAMGIYEAEKAGYGEVFMKVTNLEEEKLIQLIKPYVEQIKDIRHFQ
jgi:acetoin utilization protein AcuB